MMFDESLPRAFTVAEGRARHLSRHTLDSSQFARPYYGVRSLKAEPDAPRSLMAHTVTRAREYLPLMRPGDALSHSTALLLYGCPIRTEHQLHVSVPISRFAPSRRGVVGHRYRQASLASTFQHRFGVPVVDPVTALIQSARSLPLLELVVAVDHLICPRLTHAPIVAATRLEQALTGSSQAGVQVARRALSLARVGAESRMETLLRLQLQERGITDLELQVKLYDQEGVIGRFDLVHRKLRAIFEYDGEQHRLERAQYLKDVERLDRVRIQGWRVLRFFRDDVVTRPTSIDAKLARFGIPVSSRAT